mgnify:CR=1 FL=1
MKFFDLEDFTDYLYSAITEFIGKWVKYQPVCAIFGLLFGFGLSCGNCKVDAVFLRDVLGVLIASLATVLAILGAIGGVLVMIQNDSLKKSLWNELAEYFRYSFITLSINLIFLISSRWLERVGISILVLSGLLTIHAFFLVIKSSAKPVDDTIVKN